MSRTKNGIIDLVGDGIQYADIIGSFLIDAMGLDGIGAAGIRIVDNFKKLVSTTLSAFMIKRYRIVLLVIVT